MKVNVKKHIRNTSHLDTNTDKNTYQFLDYKRIFPDQWPLKYNSFFNSLLSNGVTDKTLNDDQCQERSDDFNLKYTREVIQFILSIPIVNHEIEDVKQPGFNVSENQSNYGQSFYLQVNTNSINEIPTGDIKRLLNDVVNDETLNGGVLKDLIYSHEHEKFRDPSNE